MNNKELSHKFENAIKPVLSKAVFTYVMLTLCEFGCLFVLIFISTVLSSFMGFIAPFVSIFCTFLTLAIAFILNYGAFIIYLRFLRKERVTIGYMFIGFKQKRIVTALYFFLFLSMIILFGSCIPIYLTVDLTQADAMEKLFSDTAKFLKLSGYVTLISVVLFCVLFVRFSFTWLILQDNPTMTGWQAVKRSWKIISKKVFKFIGFLLYANRRYLLSLIILEVGVYLLPSTNQTSFLSMIMGIATFVVSALLMARLYFSITVFYDDLRSE